MKAMKRFLSLAMVCLLLCGLLPGFAYADDPAVGAIALSNASGNAGDTVTVDVTIQSNPGVMAMKLMPQFDTAVLELQGTEADTESGWTLGADGQVLYDTYPDSTFTGKVVTYTFKILADAQPGETQVNLEVKAANYDENLVEFTVTPATVTIEGESGKVDFPFNHSASFGNNLSLNYYMPIEYVEGYELDRLEIRQVHYNGEGSDYTWREYNLTSWEDSKLGGKNYKKMVFDNIAAKELGDDLYATLYLTKDGESYENTVDIYNLKQYAYNRLNKSTDAAFKTLLVDLLNYGSQAQLYFNYNTANLAAIGEKVPGAMDLPGDVWYTSKQIGTLPVWWDQE